jgi:hypothetical protein
MPCTKPKVNPKEGFFASGNPAINFAVLVIRKSAPVHHQVELTTSPDTIYQKELYKVRQTKWSSSPIA